MKEILGGIDSQFIEHSGNMIWKSTKRLALGRAGLLGLCKLSQVVNTINSDIGKAAEIKIAWGSIIQYIDEFALGLKNGQIGIEQLPGLSSSIFGVCLSIPLLGFLYIFANRAIGRKKRG